MHVDNIYVGSLVSIAFLALAVYRMVKGRRR